MAMPVLLVTAACDRSSALKGEQNTTVTFYGLTVDQDGSPLSGVLVAYQVEAFPPDWTPATRDKTHLKSVVAAISDENGRFTMNVTGRLMYDGRVDKQGY